MHSSATPRLNRPDRRRFDAEATTAPGARSGTGAAACCAAAKDGGGVHA